MQVDKNKLDIQTEKGVLRKDILIRRNLIGKAVRKSKDMKIYNRIVSLNEINAENVCVYVSKDSEADTISVIEQLISIGKAVYAPKSDAISNSMTFYRINSISELSLGAFNVLEPDIKSEKYEKYEYSDECDVCIVPALSFDRQGFRLGYGKGYYDRFLKNFKGIKIGICFDEFITDKIPRFDTDIAVDIIVSDNEKILCKGGM